MSDCDLSDMSIARDYLKEDAPSLDSSCRTIFDKWKKNAIKIIEKATSLISDGILDNSAPPIDSPISSGIGPSRNISGL